MAIVLILDSAGVTVGFDPNPQEWGLTSGGGLFCPGHHHAASSQASFSGCFTCGRKCFEGGQINFAGGSQPQLPRAESQASGLVPLEELWVPGVRFPVSEGVQMACFGDVFDPCNCFQRLRNEKVLPENLHTGVNNSTHESIPKPSSHPSRSHPPTPFPQPLVPNLLKFQQRGARRKNVPKLAWLRAARPCKDREFQDKQAARVIAPDFAGTKHPFPAPEHILCG